MMWICGQCRYKHDEEKGSIEGFKEIIVQMQSKIEALEGGLRTIVAEEIARALGSGKEEERVQILNAINGTSDGNELRNARENKITERQKRPTVIRQSESMQSEVRGKRKNKAGK